MCMFRIDGVISRQGLPTFRRVFRKAVKNRPPCSALVYYVDIGFFKKKNKDWINILSKVMCLKCLNTFKSNSMWGSGM